VLVTSNLSALLPTALKFLDKGLLDRLIVCEDDDWGSHTPQTACRKPKSSPTSNSPAVRQDRRNGRR